MILLLVQFSLNAQDVNVTTLLEKHFTVVNQTKLNTINSLTINGSFVQNGTSLSLQIFKQRPDKWHQKIALNNSIMQVVINGNAGWEINQFAGIDAPVNYDEAQINAYRKSASIDNQLWYLKEQGAQFDYLGDETINQKKSIKLKVVDVKGEASYVWLDATTYLINQTEDIATKQTFIYLEYQVIEDIYFPKKINAGAYELEFTEIELNPKLDASLFSKETIKSVKDITKEYLKAFYDLDYKTLATFYTEESFWYDPSTSLITPNPQKSIGKDKIIADLRNGFNGVQEATYTIEKEFYSGPYVAIWGIYSYKIPAKYFQGLMHSDAIFEFNLPMVTNLVIKDGKVLEHLEHADWAIWAKQVQLKAATIKN